MAPPRIYLDACATTPVDPRVVAAMLPLLGGGFANPSSVHSDGQRARHAVEGAREQVAALLRTPPACLVFTSGGTEANVTAILGAARAERRRRGLDGAHVVASAIEHPSVAESVRRLEAEGFAVTWVAPTSAGVVPAADFAAALRDDTVLAALMLANNEVGTLQPVAEAARACRERGVLLHCDAVQAGGRIPVCPDELGADLLALSAHKLYGAKGAGALWVRPGLAVEALLTGGGQERRRRAGTENVAGIAGFGAACDLAQAEMAEEGARLGAWRDRLEAGLTASAPAALVNGAGAPRLPHVTNVSYPGLEGESLLIQLDLAGIAVSTGSACSSGSLKPSATLLAMGVGHAAAAGALRLSFHRFSAATDVDAVLAVLPRAAARLAELTAGAR